MKRFIIGMCFLFSTVLASAQTTDSTVATIDTTKPVLLVDAACGQCRMGLEGKSCDLAVRIDGKAYFVDGTGIDQHGDAHANDGFCNAIRKAKVQGEVAGNRFKAHYFQLLPEETKKKKLR